MQKMYCYVDESGQDTSAQTEREQLFVVAVTVFEDNCDALVVSPGARIYRNAHILSGVWF
jgi:hypothetical protein